MDKQAETQINWNYFFVTALAVLLSWLIHEGAHWGMGQLLGYKMHMTLNTASPTQAFTSLTHENLVSAAGPIVTLLQAVVVFILLRLRWLKKLYPFLVVCLYMRLLAAGISFLNPNDEARISASLGIGTFTLPLLVSTVLFLLVYSISRQYRLSKKFNIGTVLLIMLFASILVLADQFFSIPIL